MEKRPLISPPSSPPQSIEELEELANQICGFTIGELAQAAGVTIPTHLKHHKGFAGQIIELYLGAEAGSKPVPDFEHLGVELKTLPVSDKGSAIESTFVCTAPLTPEPFVTFETSHLFNKLKQVLWIPLVTYKNQPWVERIVGPGHIWRPDTVEKQLLKQDWEELTEILLTGHVQDLNASLGQVLQIRPKAASSRVKKQTLDEDGKSIQVNPKGFYLRAAFTTKIIKQKFMCG